MRLISPAAQPQARVTEPNCFEAPRPPHAGAGFGLGYTPIDPKEAFFYSAVINLSGQGGDSRAGRIAAAVMALAAASMLIPTGPLELGQPSSDGSDPLRMHPIIGAKEFAPEG
jgi:hypothetical protein